MNVAEVVEMSLSVPDRVFNIMLLQLKGQGQSSLIMGRASIFTRLRVKMTTKAFLTVGESDIGTNCSAIITGMFNKKK